jgi:glutathione S-transferase
MILYYYPLCPLCQKIIWILNLLRIPHEKKIILDKYSYAEISSLLNLSSLPLLKTNDQNYLTESLVISNYLYFNYHNQYICFNTQYMEVVTDVHFYRDVYMNIVYERTLKTIFVKNQAPNINKIQDGLNHLKKYLLFFENFLQEYYWMNKLQFSSADISLFTQLMCLDYCGQIPWFTVPELKKWYMRMKCKAEAQSILKEHIGIFPPPAHYELLDF